jgi:hypothetical protein
VQWQKIRPSLLLALKHHSGRNFIVWQAVEVPELASELNIRNSFYVK